MNAESRFFFNPLCPPLAKLLAVIHPMNIFRGVNNYPSALQESVVLVLLGAQLRTRSLTDTKSNEDSVSGTQLSKSVQL
jgi:hypothetical protein